MAGPLFYDRILETTTTTGNGSLTLAGAVTGFRSFADVGDSNTTYFCVYAVDGSGNPTGDWEVDLGTYTASGTTLSRDTVYRTSNGDTTKIVFSAGTKRVALVSPADFLTGIKDASVLTLGTNAFNSSERVATAGTGLTITDAGAGSTATFAVPGESANKIFRAITFF